MAAALQFMIFIIAFLVHICCHYTVTLRLAAFAFLSWLFVWLDGLLEGSYPFEHWVLGVLEVSLLTNFLISFTIWNWTVKLLGVEVAHWLLNEIKGFLLLLFQLLFSYFGWGVFVTQWWCCFVNNWQLYIGFPKDIIEIYWLILNLIYLAIRLVLLKLSPLFYLILIFIV